MKKKIKVWIKLILITTISSLLGNYVWPWFGIVGVVTIFIMLIRMSNVKPFYERDFWKKL